MNKPTNAINAVQPLTEKLCCSSSEKRGGIMGGDGTKLMLDRVVNTTCTLM